MQRILYREWKDENEKTTFSYELIVIIKRELTVEYKTPLNKHLIFSSLNIKRFLKEYQWDEMYVIYVI